MSSAVPQTRGEEEFKPGTRSTAKAMAAKQRDISVSEFFAKNRHLLGFDNPRKALLTTVKEAVDNSLDACEEAGIMPVLRVRIEATGPNRFRVGVQDNGPGIVKKQIPLIFGKLLYGSKFHRLRMSRGQQGIGISAAGMYGVLTTGMPVKIISRISAKQPAHYYEIKIDTKTNQPQILNGKGEGIDIPPGEAGKQTIQKLGLDWADQDHGTRVTIELEAKYQRGRGSVDDYLEQTAIANPHVEIHYHDPDGQTRLYPCSADSLPAEPLEIKPHPYGVELGKLALMMKETGESTLSKFLSDSFSRVNGPLASKLCDLAKLSPRTNPHRLERAAAEALYQAIQATKIPPPSTDCVVPIGEERLLKGLYQVVPGQFYAAATRPPAVYRGNPFVIECALCYGGAASLEKVSKETMIEMLQESDARTLRQFLTVNFSGLGTVAADQIIQEGKFGARVSPGKLSVEEIDKLYEAIRNVNVEEQQSMNLMRFANRVPLQFQPGACAITQAVAATNWKAYGLSQARNALPSGPITIMVHMASVWVPFTSESKEAVASYPEIQKEIRLALQAVGRKLGIYLKRKQRVAEEGERRNTFIRYLGEVAQAIGDLGAGDAERVYEQLLALAKKKTLEADRKFDDRGRVVQANEEDYGGSVIVVDAADPAPPPAEGTVIPQRKGK